MPRASIRPTNILYSCHDPSVLQNIKKLLTYSPSRSTIGQSGRVASKLYLSIQSGIWHSSHYISFRGLSRRTRSLLADNVRLSLPSTPPTGPHPLNKSQ